MASTRKPLKPVVNKSFLEGAPITTAEPSPAETKAKPAPKPAAPKNRELFKMQMRVELPKRELHATKVVTMKIPIQLYADIDEIRSETGLTATEIFVKTATPEVAELLRQLRERKAQEAQ